jgi:repressor LexA
MGRNKPEISEDHIRIGKMIRRKREALELSQQEVADIVGVSKSAVSRWESGEVANMGTSKVQALAEVLKTSPLSFIYGEEYKAEVLPFKTKRIPLLGEIAAGEPIFAVEDHTAYIEIKENIRIDFCLKVKGDSMINARILDGDLVFVKKQATVDNGEIAVVLIDDEVTLKRFYKTDAGIILKPENTRYEPRFFTASDFKDVRILGKAILFQSKL